MSDTPAPSGPADRAPFMAGDRLLADLAGLALMAMMLLTVVSSAGRFLFSAPIPDMEAIDEMLLVAVVFLPLAYTQARREHVEVTLFTDRLSGEIRRRLIWFGCLVGLVAFAVLAYAMGHGALRAFNSGDAYLGVNKIVTWPARAAAVIGLAALIIRLTLDLTVARYRKAELDGQKTTQMENYE